MAPESQARRSRLRSPLETAGDIRRCGRFQSHRDRSPGAGERLGSRGRGGIVGAPGMAGVVIAGKLAAGDASGAAGIAGVVAGGGASCEAGAVAVGAWPRAVNAKAVAQRQTVSSVFIVEIVFYRLEFQ